MFFGGKHLFREALSRLEAKPEPAGLGLYRAKGKRYNEKNKNGTTDAPGSLTRMKKTASPDDADSNYRCHRIKTNEWDNLSSKMGRFGTKPP